MRGGTMFRPAFVCPPGAPWRTRRVRRRPSGGRRRTGFRGPPFDAPLCANEFRLGDSLAHPLLIERIVPSAQHRVLAPCGVVGGSFMRSLTRTTLFLLLALGVVAGCGKNDPVSPGTTSSDDQSQVEQAVAAHPEMAEDGVYGAEGSTALGASSGNGTLAAIEPLSYWRTITSVDRRLVIDFRDPDSEGHWTTAVVTIHRQLHGTFNILTGDLPQDSTRSVVHKRLNDHWVRKVLLKRAPTDDSKATREDRRRWRNGGISGVEAHSTDE